MARKKCISTCSIPSAKDVLEQSPSTFVSNVMDCSPELTAEVTKENYKSYIVAIGKYAAEKTRWSCDCLYKIQTASECINEAFWINGINPNVLEKIILKLLVSLEYNDKDAFLEYFEAYKKQIVS